MQAMETIPAKLGLILPTVRKIAARYANSQLDADDITQNVMLNLLTRKSVPEIAKPGWLRTVIRNTAYDAYRQQVSEAKLVDRYKPLDISGSMYESATDNDLHALQCLSVAQNSTESDWLPAYRQALDELSCLQRQALVLYVEGHTYEEIADLMGTSIGTVRSRIHYARKKIQPLLVDYI